MALQDGIFGGGRRDAKRESIRRVSARGEETAEPADVAVIGGGITGCAVARDAAARGLSTVVLEQTDLAAGTSSRSTKLLHGGLRYLERGRLRLVRQALREREITARLAPDLATPLRFVLPVWPGQAPGRLRVRIGVALYDLLAGRRGLPVRHGVSPAEIAALAPGLREGYSGGVAFADRLTDDVRLTVALARDARRLGASFRLGSAVMTLESGVAGHRLRCRTDDGAEFTIHARTVINAAGAWADAVRHVAGRRGALLRKSRGAHLVISGLPLDVALLLSGERPGHRMFAIPWRGVTLFGTTDVEDDGEPGRDEPVLDDLRLLFREVRRLFPGAGLTRKSVISAFTGVRPLVRQSGTTLHASREHRVYDEDGLITIVGGKLTTWRIMAIEAVDRAAAHIGRQIESPRGLLEHPLPYDAREPALDDVLEHEMPRHADDVVFRRLAIGHDPSAVRSALPAIVSRMGARLAWTESRMKAESGRVLGRLDAMTLRLDEALGPDAT